MEVDGDINALLESMRLRVGDMVDVESLVPNTEGADETPVLPKTADLTLCL